MSKKDMLDWYNQQYAAHTKQAELLKGKEKKAHDLRIWHERSAANFADLINGEN